MNIMKHYRHIVSFLLVLSTGLWGYAQVTKQDEDEIKNIDTIEHTHPELATIIRWYLKTDKIMNVAYKQLVGIYETNPFHQASYVQEEKAALQAAQLAWLKYRDLAVKSELSLHYSRKEYYMSLAELTMQRTERLKDMMKRMEGFFDGHGPGLFAEPAKAALEKIALLEREQ